MPILFRTSRCCGPLLLGLVLCVGCGYSVSSPVADSRPKERQHPDQAAPDSRTADAEKAAVVQEAAAPSELQFVAGYTQGYEHAQQLGKPMMLFFTTKWCRFCREMEGDALKDSQVARLSKDFVCVTIDADEESTVCHDFGVRGYPTVQFVSSNGLPLNRLVGRSTGGELAGQMHSALRSSSETAAMTDRVTIR